MSQPRMRPDRAGTELGGCEERLAEESRWAGKGRWSQGQMGKLKHWEACGGSGSEECRARCNRHEGDCCG